jgi:signal peptidase II
MERLVWLAPSAILILFDRLLKMWATCALPLAQPQPLLMDVLRLTRVHNTGGAFGLLPGSPAAFVAVSSLIAAAIVGLLLADRLKGWWLRASASILFAGAVGNLIDRAAYGYVVDFFEVRGFPIFNLADACVTVGAAAVILGALLGGDRHRPRGEADHA